MTEDQVPIIPLDTSKWEEPVSDFIGEITVCEYRTTDDAKDKNGQTFTQVRGLPRPGRTWHVEAKRLDAIYDLPDGSTAPVTVYLTVDLERFVNGRMVAIPQGDNKANYIIDKWNASGIRLVPTPGAAVGKKAQFRLERSHKFSGMTAKDLLYPTKLLPDGYEFTGDISRFQVKEKQSLDQAAQAVEESTTSAGPEFTPTALVGVENTEEGVQAFVKANPGLPGGIKLSLLTEGLAAQYVEEGVLAVKDGKLVLP